VSNKIYDVCKLKYFLQDFR